MYLTQEAAPFVVLSVGLILMALIANTVRQAFRRDGEAKSKRSPITLRLSRHGEGRVAHAAELAGTQADAGADDEAPPRLRA